MLILIALGVAIVFVLLPIGLGTVGLVIDVFLVVGFIIFVLSGCSDFALQRNLDRTRRGKP